MLYVRSSIRLQYFAQSSSPSSSTSTLQLSAMAHQSFSSNSRFSSNIIISLSPTVKEICPRILAFFCAWRPLSVSTWSKPSLRSFSAPLEKRFGILFCPVVIASTTLCNMKWRVFSMFCQIFALLVIPIQSVWKLQMRLQKKIAVSAIFTTGLLWVFSVRVWIHHWLCKNLVPVSPL